MAKKLLFAALVFAIAFSGCARREGAQAEQGEASLVGRWILTDVNAPRDMVFTSMEFFADGVAIGESDFLRDTGPWAENFTWRIDDDGRLILIAPGGTQIYNIVELTATTLIYEGNVPGFGHLRSTFARRGTAAAQDAALVGTWIQADGFDGELRLGGDGNWEEWSDGGPMARGTYTARDGSITKRVDHIHGNLWNELMAGEGMSEFVLEPTWYSLVALRTTLIDIVVDLIILDEGLSPAVAAQFAFEIREDAEFEVDAEFGLLFDFIFSPASGTYSISGTTLSLAQTRLGETMTTVYARR